MAEFPTGIAYARARELLAEVAAARRLPVEALALARCHGRVLAQDIVAPMPLQPFDNSAMDGYACRHLDANDGARLRLVGERFAGPLAELHVGPGECARITTGAALPAGADAVLLREDALAEGDAVVARTALAAGANVRRAGEDCRTGDTVLRAGTALSPAQVALAAALGIDRLPVSARPTVAVFTTGDELVPPGRPLRPGEIYDANRELLMGLLRAEGLEPTAWPALPDDPGRIQTMLRDAASSFDLVLTCGGVSAGERDHVPAVLRAHGRVHFWKVWMKPGMPVLAGELGRAQVLGLPGNPVSVLATWLALGRGLVDAMQGRAPRPPGYARLRQPVAKAHARREFLRGRLESGPDGTCWVVPDPASGSHRLRAAAEADALLVLPEGPQALAAGDVVEVIGY